MSFIQSNPENLNKILAHLQTSAIMDLLLTLVRMEELREGKGIVKVCFVYIYVNINKKLNDSLVAERAWIARKLNR